MFRTVSWQVFRLQSCHSAYKGLRGLRLDVWRVRSLTQWEVWMGGDNFPARFLGSGDLWRHSVLRRRLLTFLPGFCTPALLPGSRLSGSCPPAHLVIGWHGLPAMNTRLRNSSSLISKSWMLIFHSCKERLERPHKGVCFPFSETDRSD